MKRCPNCKMIYNDDVFYCFRCNYRLKTTEATEEELKSLNLSSGNEKLICPMCKKKYDVSIKKCPDCGVYLSSIKRNLNPPMNKQDSNIVKISAEQHSSNIPKCPTCGSTNIKRITTLNRAVSIGVFGILSGKIGKNYECLNCKSKW